MANAAHTAMTGAASVGISLGLTRNSTTADWARMQVRGVLAARAYGTEPDIAAPGRPQALPMPPRGALASVLDVRSLSEEVERLRARRRDARQQRADRDHATGNVTIVERSTGKFLWASEAGDRSLWWGALKRGGARKVADRIVNNLKGVIQSK